MSPIRCAPFCARRPQGGMPLSTPGLHPGSMPGKPATVPSCAPPRPGVPKPGSAPVGSQPRPPMQTDNGAAVDLTNCDREPIHLIGAVQSFGFLLAVSSTDWCVTRASRNVVEWLGVEATDLLGRPLDQIFTPEA